MSQLIGIITATELSQRNRALEEICANLSTDQLLSECAALDTFRRESENLYERVRALFFLYAIHRFHLPTRNTQHAIRSRIPFKGFEHLLQRRFEEAIDAFLAVQAFEGPSDAISSAL